MKRNDGSRVRVVGKRTGGSGEGSWGGGREGGLTKIDENSGEEEEVEHEDGSRQNATHDALSC